MLGNKICVTTKGYQIIKDQRQQVVIPNKLQKQYKSVSKIGSLPLLSSNDGLALSKSRFSSSQTSNFGQKKVQNNTLSKLSMTLTKYEKVGIKKLLLKQQDQKLNQILIQQNKNRDRYLQKMIPNIIRKTRDINRVNNLNSRYQRSRSYADRLLHNYKSQANFGFHNIIQRKKQNQEENIHKK